MSNLIQQKYIRLIKVLKNKIINSRVHYLFRKIIQNDKIIKSQLQNPLTIPIIIINFNQLFYLEKLINFLCDRGFKNIIIIDNNSNYEPLLKYYKENKHRLKIEYLNKNEGHLVFFKNNHLQKKYGQGFYFLTDPDIIPNEKLPSNFAEIMLNHLLKHYSKITKVGFALSISDIPDYYSLKDEVLEWEKRYWSHELEKNVFKAYLDTTFALYKPNYFFYDGTRDFYNGMRLAGDFTCKHAGWYLDLENLTHEQSFYLKSTSNASSWFTKIKK